MGGRAPLPPRFFAVLRVPGFFGFFHVVENPVPHDEQARDDHVGQEAGAEEGTGDDEGGVHGDPPSHASAGTLSAQVSIRPFMPSFS